MRIATVVGVWLALGAVWQPLTATTFRLPDPPPANAWVEVTDLQSGDDPEVLVFAEDGLRVELEKVPPNLTLVCAGAKDRPVACEQRFLDPEGEVEVELPRGAAVAGLCLQGGKPAKDAEVAVVPHDLRTRRRAFLPLAWDGESLERAVTTGKDGRFLLPELAPGTYRLEIRFASGRYLHPEPFTVTPPPPRRAEPGSETPPAAAVLDLGRLEIEAGETVAFFVTDLDGRPVEGAQVGGSQGRGPGDLVMFQGATDAEGRAVVSGFRLGEPVGLVCNADDYAYHRTEYEVVPAVHECRLAPLVTVTGRVLDLDEEPVEDARISMQNGRGQTASSEEGEFELPGLTPEAQTLQVAAPGYAVAEVEVELSPGMREHELEPVTLQPAARVSGRVIDAATEAPVPGAEVTVIEPAGLGATETDADGAFELEASAPIGLGIRAEAAGYAVTRKRISAESLDAGEEVEIALSRGGRILVRAWDEETGAPCGGCEVWFSSEGQGPLFTGADGTALTGLIAPGRYNVQRPKGTLLGSMTVVEGGHGAKSVEVRAGKIAEVELGEKVFVQTLELEPAPGLGWKLSADSPSRSDSYRLTPQGRAELHRRPDEPLELRLSTGAMSETWVRLGVLPPVDRSGSERLHLPATVLTGRFVRDEEPVTATRVEIVSVQDGAVWGAAKTDETGRLALPHAAPGTYLLRVGEQIVQSVVLGRDERRDLGEIRLPQLPRSSPPGD